MLVRHRTPTYNHIDRTFEQLTDSLFDTRRHPSPAVNGAWVDDHYVLTVDLPGVPADAVSVDVVGKTVKLAARTEELDWSRSLKLGGSLDADKVTARHVDGRLTVRIGTIDAPEARSVAIDTSPAELAVEADVQESSDTTDTE